MPAFAGERPRQAREVAGRRLMPALVVRVPAIDVHEKARERTHVLVVVADDVHERAGFAEPQEVQVPRRDLPAGHVPMPAEAEQLGLHRGEPGVGHPVLEHASHERQEIEVAVVERRICASHPVPGHEQRPVKPAAVVGHEPAVARNARRKFRQERRLIGVIREQQLDLSEQAALPPPEPDQERQRPRRRRQPCGLRVQAEEGSVGGGLSRQAGQPRPIDRQERRR